MNNILIVPFYADLAILLENCNQRTGSVEPALIKTNRIRQIHRFAEAELQIARFSYFYIILFHHNENPLFMLQKSIGKAL